MYIFICVYTYVNTYVCIYVKVLRIDVKYMYDCYMKKLNLLSVVFSGQIINILCINLRHTMAQYKEEFSSISAAHRCDSHFVNYYKS